MTLQSLPGQTAEDLNKNYPFCCKKVSENYDDEKGKNYAILVVSLKHKHLMNDLPSSICTPKL